jgi:hypothetical protein
MRIMFNKDLEEDEDLSDSINNLVNFKKSNS